MGVLSLRTHARRPTRYFVRAEDVGWLLDLTGPRVRRVTGQQLRDGHGLDERSIGHAVAAVMEALASRGQLTRGQLADELRERGTGGSGQMQMILLAHAELEGLICSGPVAGGEHTYALMDERVPGRHAGFGRAEVLAELALRYVTGHGPATETATSPTGRRSPSLTCAPACSRSVTSSARSSMTAAPSGTLPGSRPRTAAARRPPSADP